MQTKTAAAKKAQEVKNAAIAIGVYGNGSKRLGDIAVTNKGLIWSNSTSKAAKDITVKWDAFIGWMQSQLPSQGKAKSAIKARPASAKPRKAASKSRTSVAKSRASATVNGKSVARSTKKVAVKKARAAKTVAKKVH